MPELTDSPTRSDILYKLGQIEAKLETTRMGWMEPVTRIEHLLEKLENNINQDLVGIKAEVETVKKDIVLIKQNEIAALRNELSTWKTRLSTVIAVISIGWILLGETVQKAIGGLF